MLTTFNDRYVVYNYGQDNANLPMGNWYAAGQCKYNDNKIGLFSVNHMQQLLMVLTQELSLYLKQVWVKLCYF